MNGPPFNRWPFDRKEETPGLFYPIKDTFGEVMIKSP